MYPLPSGIRDATMWLGTKELQAKSGSSPVSEVNRQSPAMLP
jgi:hypothetical protein